MCSEILGKESEISNLESFAVGTDGFTNMNVRLNTTQLARRSATTVDKKESFKDIKEIHFINELIQCFQHSFFKDRRKMQL